MFFSVNRNRSKTRSTGICGVEFSNSSAAGSLVGCEGVSSRTGSAHSKRTSLSDRSRGDGVENLGRITNSAVALGPSDTDVVVLVSQVVLSVEFRF